MTAIPVQVTFRGIHRTPAVESDIHERLAWLEQFYPGIIRCRVTVEVPHRHRLDGRHVHVRIEITVPGVDPVVVSHEPSLHSTLRDLEEPAHRKDDEVESVHRYARVAVHEAFDAARRRLEDIARDQRGSIKQHEVPAHGTVAELSPADGFGLIQAGEYLVYFNRASVLNDAFDELTVGTPVAFVEEKGDKGPQASTVRMLGKHHYAAP